MIYSSVLKHAEGVKGVEAGIGLAGRGVSAGQETDEASLVFFESSQGLLSENLVCVGCDGLCWLVLDVFLSR